MPFHSARVLSATLQGVDPCAVEVEVIITTGIPSFSIVGMPDTSIQESRERVRSAIKASGFRMPTDKIVVNLAPGSLRKHGSGFDLPIAMGLLAASGQIPADALEHLGSWGSYLLKVIFALLKGFLRINCVLANWNAHCLRALCMKAMFLCPVLFVTNSHV